MKKRRCIKVNNLLAHIRSVYGQDLDAVINDQFSWRQSDDPRAFIGLAEEISRATWTEDKGHQLFQEALGLAAEFAATPYDLTSCANCHHRVFPKDRASVVSYIQQAAAIAKNAEHFIACAECHHAIFPGPAKKATGKKVFKKASRKQEDSDTIVGYVQNAVSQAKCYEELESIVRFVCFTLKHKEWTLELSGHLLEKAKTKAEILAVAAWVREFDKRWATQIIQLAYDKGDNSIRELLAISVALQDLSKARSAEVCQLAVEHAESIAAELQRNLGTIQFTESAFFDLIDCAETAVRIGNVELAKEAYLKTVNIADGEEDLVRRCYSSIFDHIQDKQWVSYMKKKCKAEVIRGSAKKVKEIVGPPPKAALVDQEVRDALFRAVEKSYRAIEFADKSIKTDRKLVLAAVKQNGNALEYVDKSLKADREVVLTAVKQNGFALEYADKSLKAERDIVLAAVQSHGIAFEYAAKSLKADREMVLAAVKQDGGALEYANKSLRADREFILEAVKENCSTLEYADDNLKADRQLVLEAVKQDGEALEFVNENFRTDREVVLEAVKVTGWVLAYADDSLKADREVVLTAVKEYGFALNYASEELQQDEELKKIAEGSTLVSPRSEAYL